MSYAVIAFAGRQFMVKVGDVLRVTRQDSLSNRVLFYKNETTTKVGTPYLDDISVELEKLEDKKGKKVVVARFKAKSRHRRKVGHRQPISVVKVKSITENQKVSGSAKMTTKSKAKVEQNSEEATS